MTIIQKKHVQRHILAPCIPAMLLGVIGVPTEAFTQELPPKPASEDPSIQNDEPPKPRRSLDALFEGEANWDFSFTIYGWLQTVAGDASAFPNTPKASVEVEWHDMLDHLDAGGMAFASLRHGDWIFRADGMWAKLNIGVPVDNSLIFKHVNVDNEFGFAGFTVGHTIYNDDRLSFEGHAGVRRWWFNTGATVETILPGDLSLNGDSSWTDPLFAGSVAYALTDNWTLLGRAEIGGFGVGSDIEWGYMAVASYNTHEGVNLNAGWRHIYVDYSDELSYQMHHVGPLVGLTVHF